MRFSRNMIILVIMAIATMVLFSIFTPMTQKPEELKLGEAIAMSQQGEITESVIDGEELLITTTDGTEL